MKTFIKLAVMCVALSNVVAQEMVFEIKLNLPPDGKDGADGPIFQVVQDAGNEQVARVMQDGNPNAIVDIGAKGTTTIKKIHSSPNAYKLTVFLEHKTNNRGEGRWYESALKVLYNGIQTEYSKDNPDYRANLIIIGAEDLPLSKGNYDKFSFKNLRLYISYDGPYQATTSDIRRVQQSR